MTDAQWQDYLSYNWENGDEVDSIISEAMRRAQAYEAIPG